MYRRIHHSVSLFSNCGAGDVGYAKAGFRFDVMAEISKRRLEVCLLNHKKAQGVVGDLRETWPDVITEYRNRVPNLRPSLLAACPPCQGMSSARHDRGSENDPDAGSKDSRNLLVTVIAEVAKSLHPRIVVVENVQAFLTRQIRHPKSQTPISAAKLLIEELSDKYTVFPISVDLCDYGVPQFRKRTFLTFIDKNEPALDWMTSQKVCPFPQPRFASDFGGKPITLRSALKGFRLPSLDASSAEVSKASIGKGLHSVPIWPEERYAMVAAIPANSGRSAWQNDKCASCGKVKVNSLAATCPRCRGPLLRPVVKTRNGKYRLIHGFHTSTYARMEPDRPAATITTASGHVGSNNTIHPFENRLLSTLECSLLQTIPKRFQWGNALEEWGHTNVRAMIGEAVPPLFTELHGNVLVHLLDGRKPKKLLSVSDSRSANSRRRLGM